MRLESLIIQSIVLSPFIIQTTQENHNHVKQESHSGPHYVNRDYYNQFYGRLLKQPNPSPAYDGLAGYVLTRKEYVEIPGRQNRGDENERYAYNKMYTEQFQQSNEEMQENNEVRSEYIADGRRFNYFEDLDDEPDDSEDPEDDEDEDEKQDDDKKPMSGGRAGKRYLILRSDTDDPADDATDDATDNAIDGFPNTDRAVGRSIIPVTSPKYFLIGRYLYPMMFRKRRRLMRKSVSIMDSCRKKTLTIWPTLSRLLFTVLGSTIWS